MACYPVLLNCYMCMCIHARMVPSKLIVRMYLTFFKNHVHTYINICMRTYVCNVKYVHVCLLVVYIAIVI